MNKLALLFSVLVLSSFSMASAQCIGEAQIVAKVGSVKVKNEKSCVVNIKSSSVTYYNMSIICALDLEDVLSKGVEVGLKNNSDCKLTDGDNLSGVLVQKDNGSIELEP